MTVLKTIAYFNELTKEVKNDLFLKPVVLGTLYDRDIFVRLEKKQIATQNVNGPAFVRLFLDECQLALLEGYHVITSLFHGSIGVNGVVYAHNLGHNLPAGQVETSLRFVQSAEARKAARELTVHVNEQPAPAGPVIQNITNPTANIPNTLNAGGMALVQGLRIAIRGEQTDDLGLFFTPADGGDTVHVPQSQFAPNTPTRLQFVLPPSVTPGEWRVSIATQATGSSSSLTKDIRTYDYPEILTVLE
jgi:hypothetical protein